jgi:hypothetical protein
MDAGKTLYEELDTDAFFASTLTFAARAWASTSTKTGS